MDFLDPKKERLNQIKLLIGYALVALAIGIATLVLLYQSYGYNFNRGEVTQNGLLFVSSQPSGSAVYLNGRRYKSDTNTRVVVPAASYQLHISQTGYRPWDRPVVVQGGDVQRFDYPFLFPQKLKTSTVGTLSAAPLMATQSPDKRWLLLADPDRSGTFVQYDFKNPDKPVQTLVNLPAGGYTPGDGNETWTVVEWAVDSKHALLKHTYVTNTDTNVEFVLINRDSPVDSVDLTTSLHLNQNQVVTLFNNRIDQFYVHDVVARTLERINASDTTVVSQLDNILSFKTYGDDSVLYVTDKSPTGKAAPGQVSVVLQAGQKTITLRMLPAADVPSTYMLNLAQYDEDWYIALGSTQETAAYIYKNPQTQEVASVDAYPKPWRRLAMSNLSFLSFSSNTQFLLAESGQQFIVYDFENATQHRYTANLPIDSPQQHATWMDGNRLLYVSGGKLVVFDYDSRNRQVLQAMDAHYAPFFAPDFTYLYALRAPAAADGKPTLSSTALRVDE